MNDWTTMLQFSPQTVRLLVTDERGDDLLRARLPAHPRHPRAVLTLLEGLALYRGQPLSVAMDVGGCANRMRGGDLHGEGLWPEESALVRFQFVGASRRGRRIRGLGSFRDLYGSRSRGVSA